MLAGSCAGDPAVSVPENARPNIIFIFSDDLGIGDLSCYGATRVATPHIDRLAAQGQRFTNAYATSATSTPSRFGLLTGMYPWRLPNTQIAPGNSELIIDPECHTLADAMHDAGYVTGAVGKWHLGLGPVGGTDFNVEIRPDARDIGFDYEYLIPATVDRVPCVFVENGRVVGLDPFDPITVNYDHKVGDWPTGSENPELLKLRPSHGHDNTIVNGISRIGWMTGGRSALWVDEGIADTIALKATQFIARHKDEPFFLYMGTNDVHVPRVPHPRFAGKSGLGTRGDVILQLDWTIGEVMRTLDSLGIADNTLLVFTSDNGPAIDDGYQDEAAMRLGGHTPLRHLPRRQVQPLRSRNARSFHRAVALLCETGRAVRRLLADRRLPLARNADRRRPSRRSCPPTAATTCLSCSEWGTQTANMSLSRTARIRWQSAAANGNTSNRATGRATNTASRSNWAIRPVRSFSASRKIRASGTTWRNSIPKSSKNSQQNLMP